MDKYQETLASSQVIADDAVVAAEVKKIVEPAVQMIAYRIFLRVNRVGFAQTILWIGISIQPAEIPLLPLRVCIAGEDHSCVDAGTLVRLTPRIVPPIQTIQKSFQFIPGLKMLQSG